MPESIITKLVAKGFSNSYHLLHINWHSRDLLGGPVVDSAPNAGVWALIPGQGSRSPMLIPHAATLSSLAATESSHATMKDSTCSNKDRRSRVLQLRLGVAKLIDF